MAIRKWTVVASLALCAALALTVASVGSAKPSKAQATSGLKVALVTDIGGLNDKSFNALAYKGLKNAEKKLGIDGRVFISKSSADYIPNLSTGARSYDLVIGVGFLMADQMAAVAKRFPDTKFAIVDFPAAALKGAPKNARGILFAEQEAGCLAGVAAATESRQSAAISPASGADSARTRVQIRPDTSSLQDLADPGLGFPRQSSRTGGNAHWRRTIAESREVCAASVIVPESPALSPLTMHSERSVGGGAGVGGGGAGGGEPQATARSAASARPTAPVRAERSVLWGMGES